MSGRSRRSRRTRSQSSRKRRAPGAPGVAAGGAAAPSSSASSSSSSRSERRDAEARARLTPLGDDERPLAVTIGAVVAIVVAVANIASYAAGVKIGGRRPAVPGIAAFEILMVVMAVGMWRRRYWAVLGMQALLALVILVFGVLLVVASNLAAAALCVVMVALAGTLFWFMVKALARIQMPRRPS